MKKQKRSTVSSKLFRSSRLVKLCKTVVNSVGLSLCLDAVQPLNDTKDFNFYLLERNEEQDLRGTYLPEVVLNVDVVY